MRHLKRKKKFSRTSGHKRAMFSNMLVSLFEYGSIKTTTPKAKELRRLSEKVITRAKENSLHNKRLILRKLKNRDIVAKLFDEIAPFYKDVNGGYTRIIKLGNRMGDGAELSLIELVETTAD
jgi:large subunit ribosomal protein L17